MKPSLVLFRSYSGMNSIPLSITNRWDGYDIFLLLCKMANFRTGKSHIPSVVQSLYLRAARAVVEESLSTTSSPKNYEMSKDQISSADSRALLILWGLIPSKRRMRVIHLISFAGRFSCVLFSREKCRIFL